MPRQKQGGEKTMGETNARTQGHDDDNDEPTIAKIWGRQEEYKVVYGGENKTPLTDVKMLLEDWWQLLAGIIIIAYLYFTYGR
jgi:hypothetical protein